MTPLQLLSCLRSRDIHLWVAGDRLRYSAPTGALTPDLRTQLAEHKAEILTVLRQTMAEGERKGVPMLGVDRGRTLPLSFAQQRLWFLDQLQLGTPGYNIAGAYRLSGQLHIAALEHSLNEIVRRHESLRTTFTTIGKQPMQVITPVLRLPLPVVDLRCIPTFRQEAEIEWWATQEAQQSFDLTHGPLVRARVLQLGAADHVFLLTMHHIISDGWSRMVLFRELAALYQAFLQGKASPLSDLPLQYADFAVWQRQWLQGEALETQLTYWTQQLLGAPAVLELPTDYARPPVQTFRGSRQSLGLPAWLRAALKALSQQESATLFMTLLAAFQTLLHRYTGQEDIVVGTPIANRTRTEIEGLIGFFVNTLVLRTSLAGDPSFRELLQRVRKIAMWAYAHQDLPFEKLVEALHPARNLSHSPLFQVFFNLLNFRDECLILPGLTAQPLEVNNSPGAKFDLTFYVHESPDTLTVVANYNTDLFEAAAIRRMLTHYQTLLEGIVADPEQRLSVLPLLPQVERYRLLMEWNHTPQEFAPVQCVQQLFEAQTERTPDAVAVVYEGEQLTYRELNARANQLAHFLRRQGVAPESLVGLWVERSLDMLVGILGILKAGGAYVPLDPAYPPGRLAYIMENANLPILLTHSRFLDQLPAYTGTVICLDTEHRWWAEEDQINPAIRTVPEHLAYVIYTSGSTGTPKGVMNHHQGVVNYFAYLLPTYNLDQRDIVLQLPSLSFDASVRDLLGPLLAGAQVVLVTSMDAKNPVALLAKLREHDVTAVLSVVPTMLQGLLEAADDQEELYKTLRLILVSGEVLLTSLCRKAKTVFGQHTVVVNQYGPTEGTMTTTYHSVGADDQRETAGIGRPIPRAQVYLLDRHLRLAPIGVPAELYIGGVGVARGYLNRPELTAEKFLPHPFSTEPGARLYRTGDLARYRSDGTLEFLGRLDYQVKIHGFRVELGEIEAVLRQYPGVQDTVVVAREDLPGGQRLVAYVVTELEQSPILQELRGFLVQKLPAYMIPSAFVLLESFPLTPNGKVNRQALPAPDSQHSDYEDTYIAPRTPIEQALADIWGEVLSINRVGVFDDFFELGGHSLLATRIMARVHTTFQIDLPLRTLFEAPTVAAFAVIVMQHRVLYDNEDVLQGLMTDVEGLSETEVQRLLSAQKALAEQQLHGE